MSGRKKRILLVEPEPVIAEITAFRLELLGYYVATVPSAEEALAQLEATEPDLIITDLILPGLEGTGLIERLSSDEETSQIPIIVLSLDADLARVQAVYDLGARDFIVVPYHPEVLEEKVAKHLVAEGGAKKTAKAVLAR
jgi:CheY-like chemotaxis protein